MPVAHARCAEAFAYESFRISTNPAWDIRFPRREQRITPTQTYVRMVAPHEAAQLRKVGVPLLLPSRNVTQMSENIFMGT